MNTLTTRKGAYRKREWDRLSRDPAVQELAAICNDMRKLQKRIGEFRVAHFDCRMSGRGRCRLCAYLESALDLSGTGPYDLLIAAQSALSMAFGFIDNDRPFTEDEFNERFVTQTAEGGAA